MKFFLDSAIIEEIQYGIDYLYIDGITTNPRHILTAKKPFLTCIKEIASLVKGTDLTVSVEVNPHITDFEEILKEARALAKISPNFVIKLQCSESGLRAIPVLAKESIRVNLTLIFSPAQALQAMRLGAFYASPFLGWKEVNGENTQQFLDDIVTIRDNYCFKTFILAAAIRSGHTIVQAAVAGADIVTAGLGVYKEALQHPYTQEGIRRFSNFWDQTPYE